MKQCKGAIFLKQKMEEKQKKIFKKDKNSFANKFRKNKSVIAGMFGIICLALLLIFTMISKKKISSNAIDPELARAMKYEQFKEEDENIEGTDNVKFSAFFLRDINGDGYEDRSLLPCFYR